MSTTIIRTLEVVRVTNLTPNMKRITLGGKDLNGFPEGQESAYIKLLFPMDGQSDADIISGNVKPFKRSYTIRRHDVNTGELDLDFALHGVTGPASQWAESAQPGDQVSISGPGPTKLVDFGADWFFMVGDMTALPALSICLERLPQDARGYFVMEIISEDDKQNLEIPEGIQAHWIVNPHPDRPNNVLEEKVRSLEFLSGNPSFWVACEFNGMRGIRHYLKNERAITADQMYISSYWKMGSTDEQHKLAKREDTES